MILEGNIRGFGAELAAHLMNVRDNDHVTLHALDGFIAEDLYGAFGEAEAISKATQCRKYLFSLSLNPPLDATVDEATFEGAVDRAARALGMEHQPRAIVLHEKNGRRHAHAVFSRIDASELKAIQVPHFKRKLVALSRELYLEHGWTMPDGFKDPQKRDPFRFDRVEAGQAKRVDVDPAALKRLFRDAWEQSDSQSAFASALAEHGFVLARGTRHGFVAVDRGGKVYSLSRWCGVKSRELKGKVSDPEVLPDVEHATKIAQGLKPQGPEPTRQKDPATELALKNLVTRQREERANLVAAQQAARIARLKDKPKGIKSAFLKALGRYQTAIDDHARRAALAEATDAKARQVLIDRHIRERRAFDRAHALARRPQDTRQTFKAPAQPSNLKRAQVQAKPWLVLDQLSTTKASFNRRHVMQALARFIDAPQALSKATSAALDAPTAIKLPKGDGVQRYTTQDFQRTEAQLKSQIASLTAKSSNKVAAHNVSEAIVEKNREMKRAFGGNLSQEQNNAIRTVLGERHLSCVVGLAGAGKSTMLATANAAWRKQGVTVHGAALAGKAADGLQDSSGIKSRTLASLELSWENGNAPIAKDDVLVIDEAGMIGTRQMARISEKMQEIGAKLVLVGDPDQLQPIEAGTPFRDIINQHGAARLTEVRRQTANWQKAATHDLASGNTAKAVEAYRKADAVIDHATHSDAVEALAARFALDAHADGNHRGKLALAHKRKDVHALNQSIRAALRADQDEGADLFYATETGQRAFSGGDRIVFTRNDKDLGVKNGMLGTIRKTVEHKLTVDLDNDQKLTFDPRTYRHFDHGYAVTIHKSQGVTVDRAYVLGSRSMDEHLTYVALTRHRQSVQIETSTEDRPRWSRPEPSRTRQYQVRDGPSL